MPGLRQRVRPHTQELFEGGTRGFACRESLPANPAAGTSSARFMRSPSRNHVNSSNLAGHEIICELTRDGVLTHPMELNFCGSILYSTRTSPGRRLGYFGTPRYFWAKESMCSSAPFCVISETLPRTSR